MKIGRQSIMLPILVISGLLFAFSASATMVCPTASPLGVGCPSEGGQQYYCNSGCRLMDAAYCPTNELTAASPCATLDACGVCNTCISSYLLCTASTYPTRSCTYNDPANHCATLVNSNCNAGECASCTSGYSLCSTNHTCIATQSCQSWETFNACTNACEGTAPTLKLSFSSAGNGTTGNNVLQSSSAVLAISPSSFVGIGTTTPEARLEVIPTTGYSILAGNFKMGNIALPTADGDAATKGYVDSVISSATSTITTLWGGATDGAIWSLNSGNVGIGTTTPTEKLEINGKLKIGDNTISGENITFDSETTVGMRVVNRYGYVNITPLNTGWAHIYTDRANFIFSKPLYIFGGKVASYSTADIWLSAGGTRHDLTIANSDGNVGIGTTTPTARLEVIPATGYSILAGNFKIGNVALPTADGDAATKGYVDSVVASATSSISNLWGGTSGGDIWNLNSGNVGIGTSTPGKKFVIKDTVNTLSIGDFFSAAYGPQITTNNDAIVLPRTLWFGDSTAKFMGSGGTFTLQGDNNVLFNYWNGSAYITGLKIDKTAGQVQALAPNGLYVTGNVGIGTTTPGTLLHAYSSSGADSLMTFEATASNAGFIARANTDIKTGSFYIWNGATRLGGIVNERTAGDILGGSRNDLGFINYSSGNDIVFRTTAPPLATRLIIKSAGNVGIGTTTPLARLEVVPASGYSILAGNFKMGNIALPTADGDAATKGYVDSVVASATSSISSLWSGTLNGNIWNGAAGAGLVGIGTANPTYKLDVKGTSTTDMVRSDIGFDIYPVPNPTVPTGSVSSGGSVDTGYHYYAVTYVTALGETNSVLSAQITTTSGNNTVTLNVPVSSDSRVTARKIYRTKANTATYQDYYLATISDNTTTTYVDTAADSSLTGSQSASYFRTNTTSKQITLGGMKIMNFDTNATYLGLFAGLNVTTGGRNTFVGRSAGAAVTTGSDNQFFGYSAGGNTNTGGGNIAMGYSAMLYNTSGGSNTALGHDTLFYNQTGSNNTAVGALALFGASGNSYGANTAVGAYTGQSITTGSYNAYLGYQAGYLATNGSYNLFLGQRAGRYETGSNKIILDTVDRATEARGQTEALIYGITSATPSSQILALGGGGNVGIGTTTPLAKLEIVPASGYSILAGNYKIGNVASPTADSDVVTMGWVNSALSSVSGVAVYSTSTPATYSGSQGGYTSANALCAAVVSGTHVCTTGEMLNTINTGAGSTVPSGTTLWVSNGPPAYTANANDCMGWTSVAGSDYGTVWIKLSSGDGFGSLNACATARSFACCK